MAPGGEGQRGYADDGSGEETLWLLETTTAGAEVGGSWALAEYVPGQHEYEVKQYGPRRLWDEVHGAYLRWLSWGRPGPERFGLIVTPEGERIWPDEPTVVGLVAGVLLAGGITGLWLDKDPSTADVGDCLSGNDANHMKIRSCDDPKAIDKVVKTAHGSSSDSAESQCDGTDATRYFYQSGHRSLPHVEPLMGSPSAVGLRGVRRQSVMTATSTHSPSPLLRLLFRQSVLLTA